jgi:flavin reductase (DIM6/NTAB) family NADH-FMN oxidoreductase RutF
MTNASPRVDGVVFRRLMARWATGVSVLTAREGEVDGGLTVNAFLSISLNPPAVLVSLMRDVDTLPMVEHSLRFAVSFLAADQRPLSERFARMVPPAEKFRGVAIHRGSSGLALLDGTLGAIECRVASLTPTYDHVLTVGEVEHQELGREAPPLVFFRSTYAQAEGPDRLRFLPPGP